MEYRLQLAQVQKTEGKSLYRGGGTYRCTPYEVRWEYLSILSATQTKRSKGRYVPEIPSVSADDPQKRYLVPRPVFGAAKGQSRLPCEPTHRRTSTLCIPSPFTAFEKPSTSSTNNDVHGHDSITSPTHCSRAVQYRQTKHHQHCIDASIVPATGFCANSVRERKAESAIEAFSESADHRAIGYPFASKRYLCF